MYASETSFPRGGSKPQNKSSVKPYKSENLFTSKKRKGEALKHNIKKKKTKNVNILNEDNSVTFSLDTLAINDLQEGMRVLACVHKVTDFAVKVELPDGCYNGQIEITSISQQFSDELERKLKNSSDDNNIDQLSKMFRPGQFLPVVVQKTTKSHIMVTTNPKDINHNCNHVEFSKSKLVWAAVESHLEHGYVLNAGVTNCRVFLPHEKVSADTKLYVGMPIWCVIIKKVTTPSASNLTVSNLIEDIKKCVNDEKNLHYLIPGAQLKFEIEDVMKDGLKGNVFDDCTAFIHAMYYKKSLETHLKEGDVVKARVLYVRPMTNVVYLTLKGIEPMDKPTIEVGQILKSQVICKLKTGLCIKLNGAYNGFVSNKRISSDHSKENETLIKAIKKKSQIGSVHKCRVLDYNYLNEMYVCTFEKELLNESIFTIKDVRLGQKVNVKVKTINDKGLVVTFGHLSGFVPNLHLSNVLFTENVKKKFSVGQNLSARIWNITEEGNVFLTLKRSFVDCDLCFTSLNMLNDVNTMKKQYPGMVVKCGKNNVLVVFYGNISGVVKKKNIPEASENIDSLFYRGQVVMTTILAKNKNNLLLSLFPPNKEVHLRFGTMCDGVITSINEQQGIHVEVGDQGKRGLIPLSHLGVNLELNQLLAGTYTVGNTINDMVCIAFDKKGPIFSLIEQEKLIVSDYNSLKQNCLIRCYFLRKTEKGILVFLPVLNLKENKVEILNEHITDDTELLNTVKFNIYQVFTAKVLSINSKTKKITLTIKLSDIYENNYKSTIAYLEQYVNDIKRIKLNPPKSVKNLSKINLGQRIECVVNEIMNDGSCYVTLPAFKNVKGIVNPFHTPDKITLKETFEGVVLWADFIRGHIELSLNPDVIKLINEVQDGGIEEDTTFARILSISDDHLLGVLKSSHQKQLVVLPMKLHENDFKGLRSFYEENYSYLDKIRIMITSFDSFVIGFHNKVIKHFDKSKESKSNKKRSVIEDVEKKAKKPKLNNNEMEQTAVCNGFENNNLKDVSGEKQIHETKGQQKSKNQDHKTAPLLSGASNFFSYTNHSNSKLEEDSSSSDDENAQKVDRPKKKLSPAEQAELIRQEEQRLLKREKELADLNENPNNADDFERLLRGNPNSSKLWAQYVAFYLAAAEIEKARSVARKALETIDLRKDDEKFNVWVTLLNLENMYGTKETFEVVFEEAVRSNDALNVYIEGIKMLASMNKFEEMDDKISKVTKKFSDQYKMWLEVMKIYYKFDRVTQGRIFKNKALKTINNKKKQIDLLVQAALLEFNFAEEGHQGEAIFENIVASLPQRVDVWCTYVDQFVKKGNIDAARRVLERSVCQKLPSMKMKKLFKKFLNFEQSHGNSETVEHVKQLAHDYVNHS